ncbi:16S rRNA (cytosine(967)-C(5))-methyltransferase RsmB [Leuconostocaceae bacterium ESL0723]|nr:16S rRNA (cytosine(967)-C(5))-methyltransferase RsmB [Leuconostocaceae bacterium ESL0723]
MKLKKVVTNDPRLLAIQTLSRVKAGAYSNLQLNKTIKKHQLSATDKAFLTTLVYGVIQHRMTLDYWLAPFLAGKKVDPWVKELLYSALFQWQYLDKVPKHAVFNESIQAAKTLGHVGVAKFVTAVLHKIDREGLPDLDQIQDSVERQAVAASVPVWLVQALVDQVGLAKTTSILKAINQAPHQSVRVNTAKASDQQVYDSLVQEGYQVSPSPVADHALVVTGGGLVANSQAFLQGWLTIQDESAMLPVESLRLNDQVHSVLDAAAAPGGKTTQIAEHLSGQAQVTAIDIHDHKIKLIQDNAARLGLADRVVAKKMDARQLADGTTVYDRILVDAPCSGLGLLRRKPEIRYEKQPDDIAHLAQLQTAILDSASKRLAKGGIMVYSTCTILSQENDQVVATFLKNHDDFELIPTETAKGLTDAQGRETLHLYPDDYQTDGFFVATLRRRE